MRPPHDVHPMINAAHARLFHALPNRGVEWASRRKFKTDWGSSKEAASGPHERRQDAGSRPRGACRRCPDIAHRAGLPETKEAARRGGLGGGESFLTRGFRGQPAARAWLLRQEGLACSVAPKDRPTEVARYGRAESGVENSYQPRLILNIDPILRGGRHIPPGPSRLKCRSPARR